MGVARGVKAILKRTTPGKLVRSKKYVCYREISPSGRPIGPKLRGVARRLADVVFSNGAIPFTASTSSGAGNAFRGHAWRGADGGIRRGKAVDAQVSRLAKTSEKARLESKMLKLTRMTFLALAHHGLKPIESQRVVLDRRRTLGTAIDVVCQRGETELVLVELKSGYRGDRTAAATMPGRSKAMMMKAPLATAKDSHLHRHFAQLTATLALFVAEEATVEALRQKGVDSISGALLYVNDDESELHELPEWWRRRGERLLSRIS